MAVQELSKVLLSKIPFDQTNSFSKSFLDYIGGVEALAPYYNRLPNIKNFKAQIEEKSFSPEARNTLVQVLNEQYNGFEISEKTADNITNLALENTFTVTTGHQLNIFTGPLYFIYKIITVINACKELKTAYPAYNFVPVYWMASEDHDFEEISYFRFNGKKFTWETDQKGAVGRFDPKSLKPILDSLLHIPDFFKEAYLKRKTLSESVRHYVNAIFGDQGLVIVDADHSALKSQFIPVMLDDVFQHTANDCVSETSQELQNLGYSTQVFPREINFFYLKGNIRSRIVKEGGQYKVLDTDITFTQDELRLEINAHPEHFSPNVVLRPLYQEVILPNLAYVGGPAELVYWLQLKEVFAHFGTPFPMLMPRNFAGIITPRLLAKIQKAGLSFEEIFKNEIELTKEKIKENSDHELSLNGQKDQFSALFEKVSAQATTVDRTLNQLVAAEKKKLENSLLKIEKKILKAEKKNQEVLINRIAAVKEALFPGGSPQERKDNFLNFYLSDPNFIQNCLINLDPFDFRFHLISAHE
ncbi:MAG: bacillithiol biosynthesis cysteine-adding enzyme BshC [Cytophagales bacterium CG12_big_fil_rev_8_21_14_0_65_40_12]|nr:MAG: bacillithiol biosynthesis cysteine-adding enzyme BshC [Cytophagales bacterium CG12_big_fil_rev_8_21_14_0_65_40_12]PIR12428.1 MAG: bacillithiol biosynthesis cysteine-adding enzyme BshC [Flavobacteriales bacterium CG11_big_fil_rev_8_21_14_0_20_35_7]PIW05004.1 MAG: bacillithiol biosynthesis cysteine-adding enzyme BshC [Cytophagales bacterium CG17_big_fil_post_rev_8_21_14_2_50_40_13]